MTMSKISHHSKAGFTLIELVIVLGITGLIFSGLWGLLTSGSSQLQAQSAAQQYRQVIEATRKYLTGSYDPALDTVGFHTITVGDLSAAPPGGPGLLPTTFNSKDSYGNTILIEVETIDASKQQWRFSVYSDRTAVISDKVGAQISSLIGSEGGFVYANATDGCSAAGTATGIACGSFNSFALTLSTAYAGAITNGAGRIVTLGYTIDTNAGTAPWLYRKSTAAVEQRTMQDNMFFNSGLSLNMQSSSIVMGNGSLSMGNAAAATTGATGILYMGNSDIANLRDVTGKNSTMTFEDLTLKGTVGSMTMEAKGNITVQSETGTVIQTPAGASPTDPNAIVLTVWGGGRFLNLESNKFIYNSDERLKKNIVGLENALAKVMKLKGHAFEWKSNHEKTIGLIAQEVQEVYPELVNKGTDGMLGVDYGKLIAPVIEAIKELKKENDDLKAQVQELKASIKK